MPSLSQIMHRAWSLLRQSMQPFSRPAFAAHLRQAWHEARTAPVTDWAVLQRYIAVSRGAHQAEVIGKLEDALAVARSRSAQYSRASAATSWSAGKHRSADLMRVANVDAILRAEKAAVGLHATYTARRDGAVYVLKRNGEEFGRLIGPADRLTFTTEDAPLLSACAPLSCRGAVFLRPSLRSGLPTKPCALLASPNPAHPQNSQRKSHACHRSP